MWDGFDIRSGIGAAGRAANSARRTATEVAGRAAIRGPEVLNILSGVGGRAGGTSGSLSEAAQAARYQGQADRYESARRAAEKSPLAARYGFGMPDPSADQQGSIRDTFIDRMKEQMAAAPHNTPGTSGTGSTGGSGGGGYSPVTLGGGGAGGAAASVMADAEATLQEARARAEQAAAQLQGQYEADRDELREQFKFSESAAERDMLARAMAELERQRDRGAQAINAGYERARTQVAVRAEDMRARTAERASAMGDLFRQGAADVQAQGQAASAGAQVDGLGVNMDGGSDAAAGLAALLAAQAPTEQALTQRLGDIGSDSADWLADTLALEQGAQGSELQRAVAGLIAQTQAEHDARVQDRIARERMQYAQQMGMLQGDYRNRGFQLDDMDLSLLQSLADMQHRSAEAAADRALQIDLANMRAANSARAAGARSSGGSAAGGMPQPGTMEYMLFAADVLNQYGPDAASAILGGSTVEQLMGGRQEPAPAPSPGPQSSLLDGLGLGFAALGG